MADPWSPFEKVLKDPLGWAREWKGRTGGNVVGHLLPDVPEEIIHAAGALPFALEGAGVRVSHAQAHIPGYTCAHAMGALEMGLREQLDVLDGMVIPYVCDTTRNLFHTWSRNFPAMASEFLRLPKRLEHSGAREYLRVEFGRLMKAMAGIAGREVGDEDLAASLSLYNRSRERLREAYSLHAKRPALWTAERVQTLLASALRAEREEHLSWMEGLPWDQLSSQPADEGIPIYVRGKVWDPPEVLGLLDELGLRVVSDEMVTGYRAIAQDAPVNGDPIAALVERHLAAIPYPGYHVEPAKVVSGFLERVRNCGARGVLFLNPKFCEEAGFDTPDLQRALKEEGIPTLILETSVRGVSLGQIRVRMEAFREVISEELP
jgi:bcr-type benzoyl-CoA reductase subunit C